MSKFPECENASKNIICLKCWGMVELNCGCTPTPRLYNWCKCEHPKRSDKFDLNEA